MLNKLKLNVNLWDKYDELFELTNKQKELYRKFKSRNKDTKINKEVENAIFSLIYAPTTLHDFKNLEEYYYNIENSIPEYMKKKKNEELSNKHKLYIEILSIVKENFKYTPEYQHAIKKRPFPNPNIYDLLGEVHNINTNISQENINTLISILKYSDEKVKIDLAIKTFLVSINNFAPDTINNIATFIKNSNDLDTLEDLNTLMSKVYYVSGEKYARKATKFIKILITKKEGEYHDDLLKETINTLYKDGYFINDIDCAEIDMICNMLKKESGINPKNISTILSIISDSKFYNIEDKEIRKNILETLSKINFLDERIWIYRKYLLDIYARCEYENIKEYLLEKIKEIKSIKSFKLIVDIYPSIISHIKIEDTFKIIDDIVEFENKGSTIKKELLIPIKYDK